jgi:hypothetical protein
MATRPAKGLATSKETTAVAEIVLSPAPAEAGVAGKVKKAAPRSRKPKNNGSISMSVEERQRLVAEAAYDIAEQRGFMGGSPLDDWLQAERHDGRFILRGKEEGKPLHPSTLTHAFRKMADAEGWDEAITLYSCRHTYATELLRAGVDLRTVQARMGHESTRTTEGYLHALDVEARPSDRLPY